MMPIILKMSIMPEILIMPKMPEMPEILIINFAKVSNFGKVCTPKSDIPELSKGNGKARKKKGRDFDEKRV
jgi:hypothetical protein